jgi:hypothetical protein
MKKIYLIMMILFGLAVFCASAAEVSETVTFAWDHDNPAAVKNFEMHWGVTAGGPYAELAVIPKSGAGPGYESPVGAVVTGSPGTTETRFFVLRACGDIPQEGGGTVYECSTWSNEVSHAFWIPAEGYTAPIQFRILPQ